MSTPPVKAWLKAKVDSCGPQTNDVHVRSTTLIENKKDFILKLTLQVCVGLTNSASNSSYVWYFLECFFNEKHSLRCLL